ncbi:MAG: CDP-diacylglycerol--glycerol-3-phosphate 3-phosphatidyltransferase [Clostridia bacterium]|nr:CDP-diacylglycerol--glycerol-3-phosphate 3-phosphatidyltransferase [Clostridia bacterium]
MNTPNKITLSRLLLIPLIVFFYLAEFIPYARLVSAIIFVVACLTDFLDGYLARKNNQVTTLGKFFDTIADKVLIMTGLILIVTYPINGLAPVVYPGWLGVVCVIIILAREFIVSALRQLAAAKGKVLAADMGGKIKATVQYIAVTLYMVLAFIQTDIVPIAEHVEKWIAIVRFVLMIALAAATFLTIYSGCSYLIRNRHVFKEDKKEEKEISQPEKEMEKLARAIDETGVDPLLPQALKHCLEENATTTTKIQRHLSIGYPRAARIVDQMEEKGYISQPSDEGKRSILISQEEFEKTFGKVE